VISQNSVKSVAKPVQGTSPPPHLLKVQDGIRSEHGGIEVIVSDCVPPRHQLVEHRLPPAVVSMNGVDIIPKRQAKPPEV
jgi:hypothetical protein